MRINSHILALVLLATGAFTWSAGTIVPTARGDQDREKPAIQQKKDGDKKDKNAAIAGVIKSIDRDKKQVIIVSGGDGAAQDFTLGIGPTTKLTTSLGEELKLADLAAKQRVLFKLAADIQMLSELQVQPFVQAMVFQAINPTASKVTIAAEGDRTRDHAVHKDAKITVDRKDAKLADVPTGVRVQVTWNLKRDAIMAITVNAGKGGEKDGGRPRPDVRGLLQKVDVEKGRIELLVHRENGDETQPLDLAMDVKVVSSFFKPGAAKDLREGLEVMAFLTADKRAVAQIDVTSPTANGVVSQADPAKGTLTIKVGGERGGPERPFALVKNARILRGEQEAKLADVMPGSRVVLLLGNDRSTVIAVQLAGVPQRDGEKK